MTDTWNVGDTMLSRGEFIQQYMIAFLASRRLNTEAETAEEELKKEHGLDYRFNEDYGKRAYRQAVIAWDVVREIKFM